jgi:hypothetical protein
MSFWSKLGLNDWDTWGNAISISNAVTQHQNQVAQTSQSAYNSTSSILAGKTNALETKRTAELNMVAVENDRAITRTSLSTQAKTAQADLSVAAAFSGNATMTQVGNTAISFQRQEANIAVNRQYDMRKAEEVNNIHAASHDLSALNSQYRRAKKSTRAFF